jgi:hypothetical protein
MHWIPEWHTGPSRIFSRAVVMDSVPVRDMPVLITSTVRDGSGLDGWLPIAAVNAPGDQYWVVFKLVLTASAPQEIDLEV